MVKTLSEEFHAALHDCVNINDPETSHNPYMQAGWAGGILFGIHFACQYPKLAAKLERLIFLSKPELAGPQRAADTVAQGVVDKVLPLIPPLREGDFNKKLVELSGLQEGNATTDTPFWPLPPRPRDFYGDWDVGRV